MKGIDVVNIYKTVLLLTLTKKGLLMWAIFSLAYISGQKSSLPGKESTPKEKIWFLTRQLSFSFLCSYGILLCIVGNCIGNHMAAVLGIALVMIAIYNTFLSGMTHKILCGLKQKNAKETRER